MNSNNSNNKTNSEFLENIKIINLLNANVNDQESTNSSNNYLLSVKVNNSNDITTCECVFKILEKDKIWVKNFFYDEFEEYKTKMGFDGSWKAFFKTLTQAINKTDGGNISITTTNKIPINKKSPEMQLTIFHPLSEELKVKSVITINKFYPTSTDEFRNFNYDLMLELYESKKIFLDREREKIYENSVNSGANNLKINSINNIPSNNNLSNGMKLEVKKNIKRKFNADLINPNVKRAKTKGAQFIIEEN
jgi:hypothetical protein